ncbi:pyridoxamine kinase [Haloimpatiens lingqiaonensis]|uniref:pyridoxamine kinase n=1 Tax=Haloimpatiens lingqiaonensis TaxID=1380675 RepID=UPI0010FD7188|nr:pyridoxamine kinase [Haloimpatiens lingqiaonensis]
MIKPVKRVAAIHDLSGFGRSSLTAIIPILSTMGLQVCPLPTAILSTQTDGFEDYSFIDLTDSMERYINHWHKLKIDFDCIYSGFLGSPKQINIVSNFIDLFKTNHTLVVVDPVMGDNGKLYDTMPFSMVENMRTLITKADIITPNITEAAYLIGENINKDTIVNEDLIKDWCIRLSDLGPNIVIITSVPDSSNDKNTSVVAYNKEDGVFWKVSCKYIPTFYPGTGDSFTSVLIGSLLQGDSLPIALDRGVQFISTGIKASYGFKYPNREGILLEKVLDTLKLPVMISSYEMLK